MEVFATPIYRVCECVHMCEPSSPGRVHGARCGAGGEDNSNYSNMRIHDHFPAYDVGTCRDPEIENIDNTRYNTLAN